jgi:transcriptional regulator
VGTVGCVYRQGAFAVDDLAEMVALARSAGVGHLVVAVPDGISSSPVPFVIDDAATSVRGHLARPNSIWKLAPCPAMLIVPVSDTYISPAWYATKAEHGRVVPTWNYEVVHVHGQLVAHDDPAWVARQIGDLTAENERSRPDPWAVSDAPDDYIAGLQRAIVGVELLVEKIEATRKLSQNKSAADQAGVAEGLATSERRGAAEVRRAMERR